MVAGPTGSAGKRSAPFWWISSKSNGFLGPIISRCWQPCGISIGMSFAAAKSWTTGGRFAQWPYVQKELLAAQSFTLKDRIPVKRSFSFTGDLKDYETCPRQYQFFREYDFTPSRSRRASAEAILF